MRTTYERQRPAPGDAGLLAMLLLVLAVPVALWALAHPGTTALGLATIAGLWVVPPAIRRLTPARTPRRVCLPRTGVCVEL